MGCIRIVTENNIEQLRRSKRIVLETDWKKVPSDSRYEEKIVKYRSGRTTRMTRLQRQTTNYPHNTEFYNKDGKKEPFYEHFDKAGNRVNINHPEAPPGKTQWNSHYSQSNDAIRRGSHKTAQAILDDLDEAIKSVRSRR